MEWPRPIDATLVRAQWVRCQWRFSPLAGWPRWENESTILRFAGRQARGLEVAAALGVVSSSDAYWEAQAHIVEYCSARADDPGPEWVVMSRLRDDQTAWLGQDGLPGFLATRPLAVPPPSLVAAARVVTSAFSTQALDALGFIVGQLASSDWEDCDTQCGGDAECMLNCLAQQ